VYEKNKQVAEIIKSNYKSLNEPLNLTLGDSTKLIKNLTQNVDVIYIDPPYFEGIYETCLKYIPEDTIVVLEHVVDLDLEEFEVIKQKKYGNKFITFIKKSK
jgi:16S rRNA G966 N2-methylase RsmD